MKGAKHLKGKIDWFSTVVPFIGVVLLCVLFVLLPKQAERFLRQVRGILGDEGGIYYALLGIGVFSCTLYIAFSKYGKIRLGDTEKPQYSSFKWGAMIFTSTMAADILFYSLCEWALYAFPRHAAPYWAVRRIRDGAG